MTSPVTPAFDLAKLRGLAGEKSYSRGEDYARKGLAEITRIDDKFVHARVSGTETYKVRLALPGKRLESDCTCPAFESGFCKHLVATAIIANASPFTRDEDGAVARIRGWLAAKGVDGLVDYIVDLAERDDEIFRRLDLASLAASSNATAIIANLRKLIEKATRTGRFIDYFAAREWAAEVHEVLDLLEEIASGPQATAVIELADLALAKVEKAIDRIDDSNGHCGHLMERACEIHLIACTAAKPEPVMLAKDLFKRTMDDRWGHSFNTHRDYANVLGAVGLAEFRQLAEGEWGRLPKPVGRSAFDFERMRLIEILDWFLERDGDLNGRIALRMRDLSSPLDYLNLAEFCKDNGREADALKYAEDGLWIHQGDGNEARLFEFVVDELARLGRTADALARLWPKFEARPDLATYRRLRELAGEDAIERGIAAAEAVAYQTKSPGNWGHPGDVLIGILISEKLFDRAWLAAKSSKVSIEVCFRLAQATEHTHADLAVRVYRQRIDRLVAIGGNGNYAEAHGLVRRVGEMQDTASQHAYVADLKLRFKAKRNFMKLLDSCPDEPL